MSDWRKTATPVKSGWRATATPIDDGLGVPDSPLRQALAKDPSDVVTVETPTGPIQMDRSGQPFTPKPTFGDKFADLMRARDDIRGGRDEGVNETMLRVASGPDLVDEMAGAKAGLGAMPDWVKSKFTGKPAESPADAFTRTADATQSRVDDINNRGMQLEVGEYSFPVAKMAGAALPAIAGGAPTSLARLIAGVYQGGFSGGAGSRARVSRGEVGELAEDVERGAEFGAAAAAVGNVLSAGFRKAGDLARTGRDIASEAIDEKAAKILADRQASAVGAEAAKIGHGVKSVETMREAIARGPAGGVGRADLDRIAAYLDSPEGAALEGDFIRNSPARLQHHARQLPKLREDLAAARAANSPAGIKNLGDEMRAGADPELDGMLWRSFGQRAALGQGLAALDMVAPGARPAVRALAAPGPIQAIRNTIKSPSRQFSVLNRASRLNDLGERGAEVAGRVATPINQSKLTEDDEDAVSAYLRQ